MRPLLPPFREPQVILTSSEVPVAGRSTARTPLYYLFGRAGTSDTASMPPRNKQEMRRRMSVHAVPMLNRLSDATTPVGVLVIDGFTFSRDWLPEETLLAAIEQIPSGRTLWCGLDDSIVVPDEYRTLIRDGHILTTERRLPTIIADLQFSGDSMTWQNFRLPTSQVLSVSQSLQTPFQPTRQHRNYGYESRLLLQSSMILGRRFSRRWPAKLSTPIFGGSTAIPRASGLDLRSASRLCDQA